MEYYLAIKNKEILPFPKTWIDLQGIDAKWNKTEKAILLYVECKNIKKQMNKQIRNRLKYRESAGGCHRAGGGGVVQNKWKG